jgi:hypothetical protein
MVSSSTSCLIGCFISLMVSGCSNLFANLGSYIRSYIWYTYREYSISDDYLNLIVGTALFDLGFFIGAIMFNEWKIKIRSMVTVALVISCLGVLLAIFAHLADNF